MSNNVDVRRLVQCAEDLMHAARRVRNKYGRGKNGELLDWTEWRDVDDAATNIEAILSENAKSTGTDASEDAMKTRLTPTLAEVDQPRLVRIKAIRRRWRKTSRHSDAHDDGSRIVGTEKGWFLHSPEGTVEGPFKFAHDARDFHANA